MKTCSFFGHRKINKTPELYEELKKTILYLITEKGVDTFLFGSASDFNYLCRDVVTKIKEDYPDIKRIYVRSHFPYISQEYTNYLLEFQDDTYIPEKVINAGRASYVERNQEMIDKSNICVFYYDENYNPPLRKYSKRSLTTYQPKSGTRLAFNYAKQKKKEIINLFKQP